MNKLDLKQVKNEHEAPRLTTRAAVLLSIVSIIPVAIVGISWIYTISIDKTAQINQLKQTYIREQQEQIKQQIYDVKHFIAETDQALEKNLRHVIKGRCNEAYTIIQHLYTTYKHKKNITQIKKIIKEALRPMRYHHGQGYFFIVDNKHTEILYPIHPEYEGANLYNLKDAKGTYVIRKEVELALTKGEGFVTDYWPKPSRPKTQSFPKRSFIKYFKPLGWLVGTGLYLDDFETYQKQEVLKKLTNMHFFNQHKNFFLDTLDGESIIFNGELTKTHKNLMEIVDANGVKIYHEYKRAALSKTNKFFFYKWKGPHSRYPEDKISYADSYPKWNWMFGAGLYLDQINATVDKMTTKLRQQQQKMMKFQILLLLVLIIVVFFIMNFIIRRLAKNLTHFITEFTAAIDKGVLINVERFKYLEFKTLAKGTNQNITKLKQLQKESETAKLTQERNARFISLGEMAGGMAHEINNPLAVIKGYITLLNRSATDNQRPILDKIEAAIERIAAIITGFKSLAQTSQAISKSNIDLQQFFNQLKPLIEINLNQADISYSAQIPELTIATDPTYLSQILTNLIKNSSDAIKDLPEKWIKLTAKQSEDYLEITVQDSGFYKDIPNPEHIFEPLVTNKAPGEGTGLGLSLSKNMAKKLGGDLQINSQEEHTTFILKLKIH